jgi:26S proteasome regulatory subunit N12
MQLELFDPALISENIYIKHPVKIEQSLMEGSYSKVWNARQDVPAEEYLVFMDLLMQTIRFESVICWSYIDYRFVLS